MSRTSLLLSSRRSRTDAYTAVLGHPPLGYIQVRHHLDARHDRRVQLQPRRHDLLQHTVDTVPDTQGAQIRLDMYIAGALLYRIEYDEIDQIDYACALRLLLHHAQVLVVLLPDHLHVRLLETFQEIVHVYLALVIAAYGGEYVLLTTQHGLYLEPRHLLQLVDGEQCGRV